MIQIKAIRRYHFSLRLAKHKHWWAGRNMNLCSFYKFSPTISIKMKNVFIFGLEISHLVICLQEIRTPVCKYVCTRIFAVSLFVLNVREERHGVCPLELGGWAQKQILQTSILLNRSSSSYLLFSSSFPCFFYLYGKFDLSHNNRNILESLIFILFLSSFPWFSAGFTLTCYLIHKR